ncbi:YHS domain-containing (seleno)protein [Salinarimonas rosea]|uniref:YHS domain-containing (seleno)protein n=1 Tax=Salinarimonas rosea TaxID=552063 RepID=UPI000400397D|nr:YHS domain-containing (seleno)protein [Salinarimonas rosea]
MHNRSLTLAALALLLATLPAGESRAASAARAGTEGAALVAALPSAIGVTEQLAFHALSGFALDGLDPVTYFLPEGPRPGRGAYEIVWRGAAWRFHSASNRAAFAAGPERFAPRLGGYDPVALAQGRLAAGRPDLHVVVDGRLYLFHDAQSLERFAEAAAGGVLADAERAWPRVAAGLVDPASGS